MSLTNKQEPIRFEKMKSLEGKKVRVDNSKEEFGGGDWIGILEMISIGNFVKIKNLESSPKGFNSDHLIVHPDDWGFIGLA